MCPYSQRVRRNAQLVRQLLAVIDLRSLFFLVVLKYQPAVFWG
jgi:hypothetical protein